LDHINVWAIEDGDGYTVVDTGLYLEDAPRRWKGVIERYLSDKPVRRVIVTHAHEDHIGMAGWFAKAHGSELWTTAEEYHYAHETQDQRGRIPSSAEVQFYRAAGWSDAALDEYRAAYGRAGQWIYPLPSSYRPLADGDVLHIGSHLWQIITGSGHSRLHACLYCPELELFISGDQVLPRISSNVSVFPADPDDNPLERWYGSLVKLRQHVPDRVLVLPAHNTCFRGLHSRLECLMRGHDQALERLLAALDEPRSVTETFPALFNRDISHGSTLRLATGEALAHLNHLRIQGKVVCTNSPDGAARYLRTSD
jgi:glyoxylase-like metal-dependent hydrolase (beta-lactamase superfamily II)